MGTESGRQKAVGRRRKAESGRRKAAKMNENPTSMTAVSLVSVVVQKDLTTTDTKDTAQETMACRLDLEIQFFSFKFLLC
jgi:hypothetical protein